MLHFLYGAQLLFNVIWTLWTLDRRYLSVECRYIVTSLSYSQREHKEFKNPEDIMDYPGMDQIDMRTTDFMSPYDVSLWLIYLISTLYAGPNLTMAPITPALIKPLLNFCPF